MIPQEHLKIIPIKTIPGGQYVGCRGPEITIEHIPSGNTVTVRSERSLVKCKELGISMLEWMLSEMK